MMLNLNPLEVLKELVLAIVGAGVFEKIREVPKEISTVATDKFKEAAKEKLAKKLSGEDRNKLLAFLFHMEGNDDDAVSAAAKSILERQKKRCLCQQKNYQNERGETDSYQPGDEDLMVELLAQFMKYFDPQNGENPAEKMQQLVQAFVVLGNKNDEEFDMALELLRNDVVSQWLYRIRNWIKEADVVVNEKLEPVVNGISDSISRHNSSKGRATRDVTFFKNLIHRN